MGSSPRPNNCDHWFVGNTTKSSVRPRSSPAAAILHVEDSELQATAKVAKAFERLACGLQSGRAPSPRNSRCSWTLRRRLWLGWHPRAAAAAARRGGPGGKRRAGRAKGRSESQQPRGSLLFIQRRQGTCKQQRDVWSEG
jgi:hypothetical protein